MAREGTIRQVTAEEMERMRKQINSLRNDLDEDFESHNKIAHCRASLDEIIDYITRRDGVSRGEVSSTASNSRLWR